MRKLISKVLAKRLEKVLPNLIHPNQNAFVKGRSMLLAKRVTNLKKLLEDYSSPWKTILDNLLLPIGGRFSCIALQLSNF